MKRRGDKKGGWSYWKIAGLLLVFTVALVFILYPDLSKFVLSSDLNSSTETEEPGVNLTIRQSSAVQGYEVNVTIDSVRRPRLSYEGAGTLYVTGAVNATLFGKVNRYTAGESGYICHRCITGRYHIDTRPLRTGDMLNFTYEFDGSNETVWSYRIKANHT